MSNARGPVAYRAARITAGEVSGHVGSQITGMCDVLTRKPDRIAIDCGCAIIAPARADWIHFREITAESILAGCSFCGNVHVTGSDLGVERSIPGAGVMIIAEHGETNHSTSAGIYSNSRISHVIAGQSNDALVNYTRCRSAGMQHKERDAGLIGSVHCGSGIKRGPQFAVSVPNLLHAGIIAGRSCVRIGERPAGNKEEAPAARTKRSCKSTICKALPQRERTSLLE